SEPEIPGACDDADRHVQRRELSGKRGGKGIQLFARTPGGSLRLFTEQRQPTPGPGWILASFLPPDAPDETPKSDTASASQKAERLQKTEKAAQTELGSGKPA